MNLHFAVEYGNGNYLDILGNLVAHLFLQDNLLKTVCY